MTDSHMGDRDPDALTDRLIEAALPHVAFDGWSETTFRAACRDVGVAPAVARAMLPRGALDLALASHAQGDREMTRRLHALDLSSMRYRDKVAAAITLRLDCIPDKEAARRATTLFALPVHAPDGARALWQTADAIWTALGDTSDDVNWYTKRATLSALYGSVVLYWLGDDSPGHAATEGFIARRIENVMQFEKTKAALRKAPVIGRFLALPEAMLGRVRAPQRRPEVRLPEGWTRP